jgi:hypothetical protein
VSKDGAMKLSRRYYRVILETGGKGGDFPEGKMGGIKTYWRFLGEKLIISID